MQYAEFLKKVQDRIGPAHGSVESDEASRAIAATLETLGECVSGEEARNLADQLPKGVKEPLYQSSEDAKVCSLETFLRRISEKEGVDAGMATDLRLGGHVGARRSCEWRPDGSHTHATAPRVHCPVSVAK
jgi:uncharacterized protein (DUF2267 family)